MILRVNILFVALGWLLIYLYPWMSLLFSLAFLMEFFKRVVTAQKCHENVTIKLDTEEVNQDSQESILSNLIEPLDETHGEGEEEGEKEEEGGKENEEEEPAVVAVADVGSDANQHTVDDEQKSNHEEVSPETVESDVVQLIPVKQSIHENASQNFLN
nr:expressed protein [Hymenolepis microstoma]